MVGLMQSLALSQEKTESKSGDLRQYYSGKFGFYQGSNGINNGLLFGVDGITEFVHYNFVLTGAIDLYAKQTFNFWKTLNRKTSNNLFLFFLCISTSVINSSPYRMLTRGRTLVAEADIIFIFTTLTM